MNIKDRLSVASDRLSLRIIGFELHQTTDKSLRPSLQHLINERKTELWRQNHRRARGQGNLTMHHYR